MAHDIKIAGATYNGVPAVMLKDTTGGNVRYTDTSDATAAAGDIAAGKTAYGADGEKITGTASGGGGGDAEELEKWIYGDKAYAGSNATFPDFILNATSLRPYACAGIYSMFDTDLTFPNLNAVPAGLFAVDLYLASFTGPAVTKIGASAFEGLSGITTINTPNVVTIDDNALMSTSLKEVNFPKCKTIGMNVFNSCANLEKADLGTCEKLGMYAFDNCSSLNTLILRGSKVCAMNDASALGYSKWSQSTPLAGMNGSIYVPDALVDSYRKATNWSIFASIIKPLSTYTG